MHAWLPSPASRGIFSLVFPGIPALRIPEKIGSQSAWNRVAPKKSLSLRAIEFFGSILNVLKAFKANKGEGQ